MKTVRIGGVPEHFNYPWYLTLKNGEYKNENINLRWTDYHGGTGQMAKALANDEIDLAIVLTEGIVKAIHDGNPSKIVQTFVQSPLLWGIHTAHRSNYATIADLKGTKAAISRYGSGSHLMAFINAQNEGWDTTSDLQFEVVKDLKGAVRSLTEGESDYFMWEKYTTKPLVDEKTFKRVGEIPTPWPCFVIAASSKFIKASADALQTILSIINSTTLEFKQIPSIDRTISNRYEQQLEDVQSWLAITEWSQSLIEQPVINRVQKQLLNLAIINQQLDYDQLIHQF